MGTLVCDNCNATSADKAFYCSQCGNQLKCKSCEEVLVKGANNCIVCGAAVPRSSQENRMALNSIKFKENREERSYEIEFTNDVGKEIKEVVADLLKNKLDKPTESPLLIREAEDQHIYITEAKNQPAASPTAYPSTEKETEPETVAAYPHLDDLEIKINCRENEWLLIFAFYKSNYGTTTFSKNAVWDVYKEKRKTETRFKNLGTNWKSLFKKYISTVRENEFRFTAAGLEKVKSLLNGSGQISRTAGVLKSKVINPELFTSADKHPLVARKVMVNSIVQEEFDAYKNEQKDSLENFMSRKKPGAGNPNRIVTIAYYITKINKQDFFTEGNIDFAYRLLNLSGKPVHLKQIIINLKNERLWFQRVKSGDKIGWKLTRQGEIYVEDKLPARA